MGPVPDLAVIAFLLLIQPLVAVVYVYVAYRLLARFTARRSGDWVDNRIDHAVWRLQTMIPDRGTADD